MREAKYLSIIFDMRNPLNLLRVFLLHTNQLKELKVSQLQEASLALFFMGAKFVLHKNFASL